MRKRGTLRTKNRPKERKQVSPESTASKDNLKTPASPATSAATGQRERQSTTIRYVDRADMAETFADSITGLVFDGQTLRIEFGVTRLDDVKANEPRTARRYPACRLVLSPATAVELINRMQQIGAALTQAGVVKAAPRAGGEAAKAG
jgi:hypothetical protein